MLVILTTRVHMLRFLFSTMAEAAGRSSPSENFPAAPADSLAAPGEATPPAGTLEAIIHSRGSSPEPGADVDPSVSRWIARVEFRVIIFIEIFRYDLT